MAVIGGRGMLGSDLVSYLSEHYDVTSIDKKEYKIQKGSSFDVLVNANGNSKRFWANQHPIEDFDVSTISVYGTFFDFNFKKYVYISSSDVYPDHFGEEHTREEQVIDVAKLAPYGFHKYLAEQIVQNNAEDWIILRCSMMLGTALRKGPFYDIFNDKPLFVTPDTRLQFITTREVANIIQFLLERAVSHEIFNTGGRKSFSFKNVGKYINREIPISPEAEKQEYEMSVAKLHKVHPLKTSEEYLKEFLKECRPARG